MTILQSLDRYYDRMAARGEVVNPGYSKEPIGFIIVIAPDGTVNDVLLWRDQFGKKPRAERVPKWFGRQGIGSTPYFLWDNTAYALGISNKETGKTARDHAAFVAFHLDVLQQETDTGLVAFRRFLEAWTPEQFVQPRFDPSMLAWNVAFRLDGERQFIHQRPAAEALIAQLRASPRQTRSAKRQSIQADESNDGFCLVTGRRLPIARLHTKIKGVDGTASAEVPLVSFNETAFESYGQEQGANAPTSEAAVFQYTAALNSLLDRNASRNRLKIADTTVVFWAETSETVDEHAAAAAEEAFATMFRADGPAAIGTDDASEAAKLRDALDLLAKGRPVQNLGLGLVPGTRFHVLGLAPNAARLSVRYWLEDSFDAFAARLAAHYRDLTIEPVPWGAKPPSVQRLLVKTTALQEKFENIPPLLAGEVMRAVLSGTRYPRTLLTAAIIRLRAGDNPGTGWHAAAVRACINRSTQETVPMALEPDSPNVAYQLGRLFAVLESAQFAALGRVNAPISARYYGSASATPARVFGPLLRGLRHHVADALKQGRGGWIDARVAEIMTKLPADLPRALRLEEQGRFAVGYYHERSARRAKADQAETNGEEATQ
jgi:CRISPR-associated protein Csd1